MSKRYHPGGDFKETSRAVTESLGREVTLHGQVGIHLRAHATWAMGSPYLFGKLVREDAHPRHAQRPVGTSALIGEHLGVSLECLSKVLSRGVPGSDSWFTQAAFLTACRRELGGNRLLQGSEYPCWWLGPGREPERCPEAAGPETHTNREPCPAVSSMTP